MTSDRVGPVTPLEYRQFVLGAWRYGECPESADARLHALAMLVSEVSECLAHPSHDEAGDVCWACEALAAAYGMPPLDVTDTPYPISPARMPGMVAVVARSVQKIQQGADAPRWVAQMAGALGDIRDSAMGQAAQVVLQDNMGKLVARYQGARYNEVADSGRINGEVSA